jgi:hypothetical protein
MKRIYSPIKISIICYSISLLIFVGIYCAGKFLKPGDEMGYCVLNLYIIMPLSTFIISLIISLKRGYLFWLYPILFGFLGAFIPFKIFGTFDTIGLFFALIPALIGLGIGLTKRFNQRI